MENTKNYIHAWEKPPSLTWNKVMPNQLSDQPSLYLQQHADQPVNWVPWSEEAFSLARELDKPVLISIGYSACHWCHVMSEESFEDSYVASIMNRHFVCIKVDREERPDVDQTYLEAIHMFNQSAGWPLNVFCLPDGRPFWGGTFFPKEDQGQGIVPWPQVLMRIADHFKREREELEENASNVVSNLLHANNGLSSGENEWNNELLLHSAKAICDSHDDQDGGFTPAPKFPSPMKIDFLLAIRESQAVRFNKTLAQKIDFSVQTTLTKMGSGGMYDQIGGGFFRYSVDTQWLIPHFEKMLYDNALLLSTYSKAHQRFASPLYKEIVYQTIDWLLSDMKNKQGGFYSSVNADTEEGEGQFYLLEFSELAEVLKPDEIKEFISHYKMNKAENFEEGKRLPIKISTEKGETDVCKEYKNKLLSYRKNRIPPTRDKKKITVWNALLIRGLVDASRAFNRKDWLQIAIELNDWMTQNLLSKNNKISSISFENNQLSELSFLDDYALWAESLLCLSSLSDWVKPGSSVTYIEQAEKITLSTIKRFKDKQNCGLYFSEKSNDNPAQVRKKFWYDNATPSANSSLLRVFSTLYHLTKKELWLKEFKEAQTGYPNLCKQAPQGIGHALSSITEEAVGISSLSCPTNQMQEIVKKLSQNPYRPIHISNHKDNTRKNSTLRIGQDFKEEIKNSDQLIEKLYS